MTKKKHVGILGLLFGEEVGEVEARPEYPTYPILSSLPGFKSFATRWEGRALRASELDEIEKDVRALNAEREKADDEYRIKLQAYNEWREANGGDTRAPSSFGFSKPSAQAAEDKSDVAALLESILKDRQTVDQWLRDTDPREIVRRVVSTLTLPVFRQAYDAVVRKNGARSKAGPHTSLWNTVEIYRRTKSLKQVKAACAVIAKKTAGIPHANRKFGVKSRGRHTTESGILAEYNRANKASASIPAETLFWREVSIIMTRDRIAEDKITPDQWLIKSLRRKYT